MRFKYECKYKRCFVDNKIYCTYIIKRKRGKIVNIASLAAKIGLPLLACYSVPEFAVVGFTQTIAQELALMELM
jgi:short-subunit dehydrogenase